MPMIVYIVEDDDALRNGFVRLLHCAGFNARPFGCAEHFLTEVVNDANACVLLDITTPRTNGLDVQRRLRDHNITLPVIVMSAQDDDDLKDWSRSLGAKMFLRKPVDDQALLDAINWVTQ
jgi:FixJ family two-component response regulator